MSAPIEIRNSPRKWLVRSVAVFVVAAILGFLAFKAIEAGAGRGPVSLTVALTLGALALALYDVRRAYDGQVQVVLDERGFRDRRAGNVLVPWERVRAAGTISIRNARFVTFRLDGPMPRALKYAHPFAMALPGFDETLVRMDVTVLDRSLADILAAVRGFAPHVAVEG